MTSKEEIALCEGVGVEKRYLAQWWDCEPDSRCEYINSKLCKSKAEAIQLSSSEFKTTASEPIKRTITADQREKLEELIILKLKKAYSFSYKFNGNDVHCEVWHSWGMIMSNKRWEPKMHTHSAKAKTRPQALYALLDKLQKEMPELRKPIKEIIDNIN